jgi:superfamily II DNA or RNA helicase/ankyrin repeat protein
VQEQDGNFAPRGAVSCLVGALSESIRDFNVENIDFGGASCLQTALDKLSTHQCSGAAAWKEKLRKQEVAGWKLLNIPPTAESAINSQTTVFGESFEVYVTKYYEVQRILRNLGRPEKPEPPYTVTKVLMSDITASERCIGKNAAVHVPQTDTLENIVAPCMVRDRGVDVALVAERNDDPSRKAVIFIQCKVRSDPRYANIDRLDRFMGAISKFKKHWAGNTLVEGWLLSNVETPPTGFTVGDADDLNTTQIDPDAGNFFKFVHASSIGTLRDAMDVLKNLKTGRAPNIKYATEYIFKDLCFESEKFNFQDRPLQAQVLDEANKKLLQASGSYMYTNAILGMRYTRCQLIAACGSGKTVMTAKLAMLRGARRGVFVAPFVTLAAQSAIKWYEVYSSAFVDCTGKRLRCEISIYCSASAALLDPEENSGQRPSNPYGIKRHKDAEAALNWLKEKKTAEPELHRFLMTTYTSMGADDGLFTVAEELHKSSGFISDILVLDESHYSAGRLYDTIGGGKTIRPWAAAHFFPTKLKLSVTATPRIHPSNDCGLLSKEEIERMGNLNGFWGFSKSDEFEKGGMDAAEVMAESSQSMDSGYDPQSVACQNDKNGIFGPLLDYISLNRAKDAGLILPAHIHILAPYLGDRYETPETLLESLGSITLSQQFNCKESGCLYCQTRSQENLAKAGAKLLAETDKTTRADLTKRSVAALTQVLYEVATKATSKVVSYSKSIDSAVQIADVAHILATHIANDLERGSASQHPNPVFDRLVSNDAAKADAIRRLKELAGNCATVSSKDKGKKIKEKLEKFKDEGTCGFVSNVRIMIVGQDIPAIDGVLFMDPIHSIGNLVQAIGRGMRTNCEAGKAHCNVYLAGLKSVDAESVPLVKNCLEDAFNTLSSLYNSTEDEEFKFSIKVFEEIFYGRQGMVDILRNLKEAVRVARRRGRRDEAALTSGNDAPEPPIAASNAFSVELQPHYDFFCKGERLFENRLDALVNPPMPVERIKQLGKSLLRAAKEGNFEDLKRYSNELTNVDLARLKDRDGYTALHILAESNAAGVGKAIRSLVKREANLTNAITASGFSALEIAYRQAIRDAINKVKAANGYYYSLDTLKIKIGPALKALLDLKNPVAQVATLYFVKGWPTLKRYPILSNQILERVATGPLIDDAFEAALEQRQSDIAEFLVNFHGRVFKGALPLVTAASKGYLNFVKKLLELNMDPNVAVEKYEGKNALQVAICGYDTDVVRALLNSKNIQVDLGMEYRGDNILISAIEGGHAENVKLLLDDERLPRRLLVEKGVKGQFPSTLAVGKLDLETFKRLIELQGVGADLRDAGEEAFKACLYHEFWSSPDSAYQFMEFILKDKKQFGLTEEHFNKALLRICQQWGYSSIELRIVATDRNDLYWNPATITILVEAGANVVGAISEDGNTPLTYAMEDRAGVDCLKAVVAALPVQNSLQNVMSAMKSAKAKYESIPNQESEELRESKRRKIEIRKRELKKKIACLEEWLDAANRLIPIASTSRDIW